MSTNAHRNTTNYAGLSVTDLVLKSQRKDEAALTELLKRHNAYIKKQTL
jgi:hypothetical protein